MGRKRESGGRKERRVKTCHLATNRKRIIKNETHVARIFDDR